MVFVGDGVVDAAEWGLVEDAGVVALVGLAGLADGLDLMSVAEGVETQEQADLLKAQGWTHGQGYFFGRPRPLP